MCMYECIDVCRVRLQLHAEGGKHEGSLFYLSGHVPTHHTKDNSNHSKIDSLLSV